MGPCWGRKTEQKRSRTLPLLIAEVLCLPFSAPSQSCSRQEVFRQELEAFHLQVPPVSLFGYLQWWVQFGNRTAASVSARAEEQGEGLLGLGEEPILVCAGLEKHACLICSQQTCPFHPISLSFSSTHPGLLFFAAYKGSYFAALERWARVKIESGVTVTREMKLVVACQ